ncbi:MAG: BUG/TctC family periplasmic protein, partial [uncultured Acetobacteraceae bacterium]
DRPHADVAPRGARLAGRRAAGAVAVWGAGELARAARHHGRALRARRHAGHRRAAAGAEDERIPGPGRRGGEPRRRRLHHRHARRRAGAAGRLHGADGLHLLPHRAAHHPAHALRPGGDAARGVPRLHLALHPRGAGRQPGARHRGLPRAGEGAGREAQLRLGRQRDAAAPRRRAVQADDGRGPHAHLVPRHRPRRDGAAGRRGFHGLRRRAGRDRAHRFRRGAAAGDAGEGAHRAVPGRADDGGERRAPFRLRGLHLGDAGGAQGDAGRAGDAPQRGRAPRGAVARSGAALRGAGLRLHWIFAGRGRRAAGAREGEVAGRDPAREHPGGPL